MIAKDPRSHWRTHTIELENKRDQRQETSAGASLSSGKNQPLGLVCLGRSEDSWDAEGPTKGRMEGLPQGVATTVAPVTWGPRAAQPAWGQGTGFPGSDELTGSGSL